MEKKGKDFVIKPAYETAGAQPVTLKNFDPLVDKIRTSDGDFTLQEILDHGNNAPFYKQAKINLEVQQKAKTGKQL